MTTRRKSVSESTQGKAAVPGKATLAKSKDPNFRPSTLYLRKKTLAECEYRLKTTDDPRDMSELVEELMAGWLSQPSKSRF
jgi:hypothetical protein